MRWSFGWLTYTVLLFMPALLGFGKWKRKGFVFLAIYFFCYATTEVISNYILKVGVYNHYIYATNMLISSLLLFAYFCHTVGRRFFTLICAGLLFAIAYLSLRMWQPSTVLQVKFVAGYYIILEIASLMFIWQVIVMELNKSSRKPLWFGAAFIVFFALALTNLSLEFAIVLKPADKIYFFWSFHLLTAVFHLVVAALLIRLPANKPVISG